MSRSQSAHPVPVVDLVPRVQAWAEQLRRWPSQNQVQAEFRVGVGKARAVLATLRGSGFDPATAPVAAMPETGDTGTAEPVGTGADTAMVVPAGRRLHSVSAAAPTPVPVVSGTGPDTVPGLVLDTVAETDLDRTAPGTGPGEDQVSQAGAGEVFALASAVAEPVPSTGHTEPGEPTSDPGSAGPDESGGGAGTGAGGAVVEWSPPAPVPEPVPLSVPEPALAAGLAAGLGRWRLVALVLLSLPAFVAIWGGWVGLGRMTGFGDVVLLPGIADDWVIDSAITLPIGVETYAAFALGVWLAPLSITERARRFAMWSALGALGLGMAGQVAYHLMSAAEVTTAPWLITTVVACLPVGVLGCGAALAHLLHTTKEDQA